MTGQWNRFWMLAVRDGLIVAAAVALWLWLLPQDKPAGIGMIALHVTAGLMAVICGFLLHEWGHLTGAWISGSVFVLPASPAETPFLFRFNNVRNSRGQFCAMSMGGFASSIVFVVFLLVALPGGLLATYIAQGITALGVLATLATEVPGLIKVMRGAPIPGGAVYVSDPSDVTAVKVVPRC